MSNHYTYRAEWSPDDGEYVGLVAEFPSLSWLAPTAAEAVAGASELVEGILADMEETGETPPVPLTERRYSGNLSFRTSPTQHRALAIEAAEQGVSVNQLLIYKTACPTMARAAAVAEAEQVVRQASADHGHYGRELADELAKLPFPGIPSGFREALIGTPAASALSAELTEKLRTYIATMGNNQIFVAFHDPTLLKKGIVIRENSEETTDSEVG